MLLGVGRARSAGARARARPAALHARPAGPLPRRRRRPVPGRLRGGGDAEPVRALQRLRAPRRHARAGRPRRRGDAGHRALRARGRRRRGSAAARRRRPGQGPGVHALRAWRRRRSRGCASRSARCASPRCASAPARPGSRSRTSPTRRTSASSPAPTATASSPATVACARAPGDVVDARRPRPRPPPRPARLHGRPAPRAGDRRRARRSTCSRRMRAPTASSSVGARTCAAPASACARRRCTATAPAWTGQAALPPAPLPVRLPGGRAGPPRRLEVALDEPVLGRRAGAGRRASWTGDLVLGHGTVAADGVHTLRWACGACRRTRSAKPSSPSSSSATIVRLPSGSLVPAEYDPSVLLTTAGMQPLKPYFLGHEKPPHNRAHDVPEVLPHDRHRERRQHAAPPHVLRDARQLLDRRLLQAGRGRVRARVLGAGARVRLRGGVDHRVRGRRRARARPRRGGDRAPGRRSACRASASSGSARDDNFWQAGPTGPCGPCSELYLDRGPDFGGPDDRPGDDTERFLEYWNLVFMQYDQNPEGVLTPLPSQNIDTGLGLNRMAAILQDVPSVFETDQFAPLMALGEELSGRSRDEDFPTTRALRILADHSRAATFLIADGIVPSNEDRGYILRRVLRRAIQQGRTLGMEQGFLPRYAEVVREIMGRAYPELNEQREAIDGWLAAEEEGFGRTLEQGTRLLDALIERAREQGDEGIASEDAFRLHDTFGFPIDLTLELAAEHGLGVDEQGFEVLMEEQRRAGARGGRRTRSAAASSASTLASSRAGPGSTTTSWATRRSSSGPPSARSADDDGRVLVKLAESPFYPEGGGQVSDPGSVGARTATAWRAVEEVVPARRRPGVAVAAGRGRAAARASACSRRCRPRRRATRRGQPHRHPPAARGAARALGTHVRQAGSYVGPDKLRFDFTHGSRAVARGAAREVEDQVNAWVLEQPSRAGDHDDARGGAAPGRHGAVRREVRRRRAHGRDRRRRLLARALRRHARALDGGDRRLPDHRGDLERGQRAAHRGAHRARGGRAAARATTRCSARPPRAAHAARAACPTPSPTLQRRAQGSGEGRGARQHWRVDADALAEGPRRRRRRHGAGRGRSRRRTRRRCSTAADRVKARLATTRRSCSGRRPTASVHLVASVAPSLVERGLQAGRDRQGGRAGRPAAAAAGRDTMAQAGGRDPDKLAEALGRRARRRSRPRSASLVRVLALDYGSARCGVRGERSDGNARDADRARRAPGLARGLARIVGARARARAPSGSSSACRWRSPGATRPRPARRARSPTRLRERLDVPVELYDERFTTTLAARVPARAPPRTPARRPSCSRAGWEAHA